MKIKAPIVYQIDVTNLAGEIVNSSFNLQTPEETMALVKEKCVNDVIIGVTACSFYFENGGTWRYYDEIVLWSNGERIHALLKAVGCGDPQFTLCDPNMPVELTCKVEFLDEDGRSVWDCEQNQSLKPTKFEVPQDQTISLEQMFEALMFWLPKEESFSTPTLDWRLPHRLSQD